jgi:hypothetical protein
MTTRKLSPAQIADQQRGSTRLGPGLWVDRHGHVHVSITELLAMVDLEDTLVNRTALERMVERRFADCILVRQEPDSNGSNN